MKSRAFMLVCLIVLAVMGCNDRGEKQVVDGCNAVACRETVLRCSATIDSAAASIKTLAETFRIKECAEPTAKLKRADEIKKAAAKLQTPCECRAEHTTCTALRSEIVRLKRDLAHELDTCTGGKP